MICVLCSTFQSQWKNLSSVHCHCSAKKGQENSVLGYAEEVKSSLPCIWYCSPEAITELQLVEQQRDESPRTTTGDRKVMNRTGCSELSVTQLLHVLSALQE